MAEESSGGVTSTHAFLARAKRALQNLVRSEHLQPDLNDIFTFGGLAGACYGISLIHVPSAWIVGGAVLFCLGVRR